MDFSAINQDPFYNTIIYEFLHKEKGLSRTEFKNVLLIIEDSLKKRRAHHGHPRGYIDFLKDFIPDIRAREAKGDIEV